ncbi:TOBE domain-containing protein [Hydrogenimonas cancrithermarum]|uniref:Mop domain-containing protein n=1 Tax=Hydrogenimonas cancrithermarum TaxID=2993563 RepID=A0ABM8FN85_9BACT|nr:TOBE domain-containing protein [Hydrogenimonas cancrithermarum]BDY12922.1 hypothetical protein HCR_12340 [Hydrogenimonas cancrithermarum]BDY13039.1 hypothetical protein HCR_13510 [Hydrogenimonas cancrithermarum]
MKISARNAFKCTVTGLKRGAVNTEVEMALENGTPLCAIITDESAESLGLAPGKPCLAILKASWIMLAEPSVRSISARNKICGTVSAVKEGAVNTEVILQTANGDVISVIVTRESALAMKIEGGSEVCAVFKAGSVILATDKE